MTPKNPDLKKFIDLKVYCNLDGEEGLKREGGGGVFNLAERITCSKNTVVAERVDFRVVQFKSLLHVKVFNSLVGA